MLPFALLLALVEWQRQIQIGASLLVIGFGIFRLVDRRHPRALARIPTDAIGALVFRRSDRAWCGTDAGADLSRTLPASRPRQGSRSSHDPHEYQSRNGRACSIVHATAMITAGGCLGVARLPLSWSEIRLAELV